MQGNDWFYWRKNKHAHFIVWRHRDDKVAHATVKQTSDGFTWTVDGGPRQCGTSQTLNEAKREATTKVLVR